VKVNINKGTMLQIFFVVVDVVVNGVDVGVGVVASLFFC
jgi:hypothetical protein